VPCPIQASPCARRELPPLGTGPAMRARDRGLLRYGPHNPEGLPQPRSLPFRYKTRRPKSADCNAQATDRDINLPWLGGRETRLGAANTAALSHFRW
jgi:hypothetical protein